MLINRRFISFEASALLAVLLLSGAFNHLRADTGACGGANVTLPFTDVAGNAFFCQIAAAYFAGLTNGTSATTFSPANNVTRDQMTAFITRTLDQSLKRGSRRAALGQHWTPGGIAAVGETTVGLDPVAVAADGDDIWVLQDLAVSRVRASDGRVIGKWTEGPRGQGGVVVALGRVFVTGDDYLYMLDPAQPPGPMTKVASGLGTGSRAIAFDGEKLWIVINNGVAIVTPGASFTVKKVTGLGFTYGMVYDGANIWVTNVNDALNGQSLQKLDAQGNVIQTVAVGARPSQPVFDGTNIWVPNELSDSVTVVRAATGAVLATLTGNGLGRPSAAAFDGQRVLVTNFGSKAVSLWKAADFSPLGSTSLGTAVWTACSDGLNFWVIMDSNMGAPGKLVRF
jgi:hypothetical protein